MRLQLIRSPTLRAALAGAALAGCAVEPVVRPPSAPVVRDRGRAPNRVSLTLQQDLGFARGTQVCGKQAQLTEGFACFHANETQYHGAPLPSGTPRVAAFFPATMRVLAGFDRVLGESFTVGVRGGVVVRGGGPKPDGAEAPAFLPFHGEARVAYWFGAAPFSGTGFRGGVFLAGGIAQVDAAFRVRVDEDTSKPPPVARPADVPVQTLDAYKKMGTGFVGGGVAVACAVTRSSSFFLNLKVMQLFPSSGTALSPEIGYEHAF